MNPNCPKCGGPVTAGAANCEYCGAGLHEPEPAVAQEAAPASASVQEAGQWLEQLSDQQLQKFEQDFTAIFAAGDEEATEKWIMQWEQWLHAWNWKCRPRPTIFPSNDLKRLWKIGERI